MNNTLNHTIILTIILIFSTLLISLNLNSTKITFTDELLFEEASYNMANTNNYLTPYLSDTPWLEKPPLYFWLTSSLFHISRPFAPTDPLDLSQSMTTDHYYRYPWIRRFWTTVATILTLIYTYRITKLITTPQHAIFATLALISSPLFLFTTLTASLDLTATAFITLTIYYYLRLLHHTSPPTKLYFLVGITAAAAFMTRSFLGLTPLAVIVIHQLFIAHPRLPYRQWLITLITFLTIVLPWHIYIFIYHTEQAQSIYFGFNVVDHGVKIPPGYDETHPWYYLKELTIFAFWFPLALLLIYHQLNPFLHHFLRYLKLTKLNHYLKQTPSPGPTSHLSVISLWLIIPLIALSAAATRHSWYIVQAIPPIAVLASLYLVKLQHYFEHTTKQVLRYLSEIAFLTLLLVAPTTIITHQDRDAPVITAIQEAAKHLPKDQPVYSLEQPYLPHTKLFHPRPTQIVSLTDLPNLPSQPHPVYIFIAGRDQTQAQQLLPDLQKVKDFTPGALYHLP